jgi:type IV pilus assembly protein PilM
MSNFGNAHKPLGIDLGASCIKAVQLSRAGRTVKVKGIYKVDINREKTERPSPEIFIESLKRLFTENKIHADLIVSSFPLSLAIVRNTVVPFGDRKKINQVIKFQAEPHIPFPIEEVVIDFHELAKEPEENEKTPVIIVGAKKDRIAKHLEICKEGGVDPAAIGLDAFLLVNNYLVRAAESTEESIALLDIGATKSLLVLMREKKILLLRSINVGGDHVTEALQNEFGIDFQAAENIKKEKASAVSKENPTDEEKRIYKAIGPVLHRLAKETDRSIRSASATLKGAAISMVYLSGGGALLKDTLRFFSSEFGCKSDYLCHLSPFKESGDDNLMSGMSIATGAALQGLGLGESMIDLRREEFIYTGAQIKMKRQIAIAASLGACVIGLLLFRFGQVFVEKRKEYTQVQRKLEQTYRETFPDERMVSATSVVPTIQKRLKDYQESYESFSVLSESAISSLEILREISSRIPREIKVQVTDLSIGQDEVEMEGLIDNPGDADKIKLKLAESNYFSSVDVPSTTQEDHKYKFKIAAIVKKT